MQFAPCNEIKPRKCFFFVSQAQLEYNITSSISDTWQEKVFKLRYFGGLHLVLRSIIEIVVKLHSSKGLNLCDVNHKVHDRRV